MQGLPQRLRRSFKKSTPSDGDALMTSTEVCYQYGLKQRHALLSDAHEMRKSEHANLIICFYIVVDRMGEQAPGRNIRFRTFKSRPCSVSVGRKDFAVQSAFPVLDSWPEQSLRNVSWAVGWSCCFKRGKSQILQIRHLVYDTGYWATAVTLVLISSMCSASHNMSV